MNKETPLYIPIELLNPYDNSKNNNLLKDQERLKALNKLSVLSSFSKLDLKEDSNNKVPELTSFVMKKDNK